jgi:4-hydroxyproline epimerase
VPTIRGRAYISAETTLVIEPDDPFAWGIVP